MITLAIGILLSLAGEPPAREGKLDAQPAGRFAVGNELEQTVAVTRRSTYQVSGNGVVQAARYTLTSRLTVTAVRANGDAVVRQVISAANLVEADDTLRPSLADGLRQAVGAGFELTVSPTGVVSDFRGAKDPIRVQQANNLGGPSIRLWSVLDADAWRELAGLTYFAPEPAGGQTADRPLGHDWGPLGAWAGRTTFSRKKAVGGTERVEFRHVLSHRPPAAGADRDLPLRIIQPRFAVQEAGGVMQFDTALGRVTAADETFQVSGAATVVIAGQALLIELVEGQRFEVRVRPPGEAVLKARPRDR